MYIFLDIDGVLKPDQNSFSGNPHNVFDQNCLDNFENAVRPFDNIKIVISSTWKLVYSLKKIRKLFSDDIQPLVIGMTPDAYGQTTDYERYKEVCNQLLESRHAYHCYCTKEELDALRAGQLAAGEQTRYDGRCRDRAPPRAG